MAIFVLRYRQQDWQEVTHLIEAPEFSEAWAQIGPYFDTLLDQADPLAPAETTDIRLTRSDCAFCGDALTAVQTLEQDALGICTTCQERSTHGNH